METFQAGKKEWGLWVLDGSSQDGSPSWSDVSAHIQTCLANGWIGIQKVKKVFTKLFNDDDHVENSVSVSVLRVWICAFICNQDIIN